MKAMTGRGDNDTSVKSKVERIRGPQKAKLLLGRGGAMERPSFDLSKQGEHSVISSDDVATKDGGCGRSPRW